MARKAAGRNTLYWILAATAVLVLLLIWRTRIKEPFQDKKPTIDIVVARYKEPIDWLNEYKDYPIRRIYIYNKSESPVDCPKLKNATCYIENLPNVGVCDHTYLYHILKVYDNPEQADMTIFIPASTHSNETKRTKLTKILSLAKDGKPSMSGYRVWSGRNVQDEIGTFSLDEWKVTDTKNRDSGADFHLTKADPRPFGEWYKKYFPNENNDKISMQGLFAVTRDMIRSNSLELYTNLIATVDKDKFPEAAHYMERSWATIFKSIPYDGIL